MTQKISNHFPSLKNKKFLTVDPACSHLKKLTVSYRKLSVGKQLKIHAITNEYLVTLLSGEIVIAKRDVSDFVNKDEWPLSLTRRSVFEERASSIYVTKGDKLTIKAARESEVIVSSAPSKTSYNSQLILPAKVKVRKVGRGQYKRHVHDILSEKTPADTLLAGETFNQPGCWSSFPPHKHDQKNGQKENKLEEVYFFKVFPENKFGIIRLYGDRFEETITVKNNSFVTIPKGYHPVSALPDTKLYYYWVLAGKERQLRFSVDPNFR